MMHIYGNINESAGTSGNCWLLHADTDQELQFSMCTSNIKINNVVHRTSAWRLVLDKPV